MKEIEDLKNAINEVSTSDLSTKTKKIVLALLGKEIFETRAMKQQIVENKAYFDEDFKHNI